MKRALWLSILMAGVLGNRSLVTARSAGNAACALTVSEPVTPSADLPWAALEGCTNAPPLGADADHDFEETWTKRLECGEAARTVVGAGTDADREQLWSIFDALPDASPMAEDVLDAFLDRHVERALAALEDVPLPATIEPLAAKEEIPGFLQDGPVDMQQAWRLYQTVVAARQRTFDRRSADDSLAFQSNPPAFRHAVAAFLRGQVPPAETARELSRYQWAGWCGTGSGQLYVPQAKALLIAHLQLGHIDLALAADGGLTDAQEPAAGWDRRLLTAAGIDWERFDLGAVLSGRVDMAVPLARHGSERAARSLLAGARVLGAAGEQVSNEVSESLLWPLAALVEPGEAGTDYGMSDSRELERDCDAEPIGGDIQEGVLDLLAENVGPGAGRREAEAASHLLIRLSRPESGPAFRAMLRSPYDEVRKRGAIGLRALGETPADPLPSRPVVFRFVVDGKPAAQRTLDWTLRVGEDEYESGNAQSDGDGVMRLARDPFVDPRRRVTSVRFATPDVGAAVGEWFATSLDAPTDLDAVTTVSVRTGSLTVIIPQPLLDDAESRPPTLLLLRDDGDNIDEGARVVSANLPVVSNRILFSRLQHGHYQVWLHDGVGLHVSPPVEVGERPGTTTVSERPSETEGAEELTPR
jgi:hypothetical protein